jgi:hypothetical protein
MNKFWPIFIGVMALLFLGFISLGMKWEKEYDSSETKEVTIITQVVNSPHSKYSYTECVFEYEGERHITDFRPCTAFVGEKLEIRVTPEGKILDQYTEYK